MCVCVSYSNACVKEKKKQSQQCEYFMLSFTQEKLLILWPVITVRGALADRPRLHQLWQPVNQGFWCIKESSLISVEAQPNYHNMNFSYNHSTCLYSIMDLYAFTYIFKKIIKKWKLCKLRASFIQVALSKHWMLNMVCFNNNNTLVIQNLIIQSQKAFRTATICLDPSDSAQTLNC